MFPIFIFKKCFENYIFWTCISYDLEFKLFLYSFLSYHLLTLNPPTIIAWLPFPCWKMGRKFGWEFWQVSHWPAYVSQLFQLRQSSVFSSLPHLLPSGGFEGKIWKLPSFLLCHHKHNLRISTTDPSVEYYNCCCLFQILSCSSGCTLTFLLHWEYVVLCLQLPWQAQIPNLWFLGLC